MVSLHSDLSYSLFARGIDKNSASSKTFSYDEKGNLLDDGTNAYAWDAEDRLIQSTYPGTGNNTQFAYDQMDRCVQIQENGSTPSYSGNATKNFIWCGSERCEERDSSNAVVSRFCGMGQATSGSNYFYAFDHLGSVREVTDSSGNVLAAFGFDPYGNRSVLSGTFKPAFGFTGIYQHSRTNLALTWFRQYNPALGRWLSRDPLGETAGMNLYGYVRNNPISFVDPLGLYDYSQQETQRILNESAEQSNSGTLSGLVHIAWNSLWAKDYGYIPKSKNDTFCIQGQKLDAYQFTNFLAGYSARQYDQTFQGLPALGTLKAVGLGWHVLGYGLRITLGPERAASFTRGYWDLLNSRGGADIEAGAWYAHDPTRLKSGKGSGYDECGCK